MTTDETIHAKHDFERSCAHEGVEVQSYRGDNGRFHDLDFVNEVHAANQRINFCGVGAHNQNGVAENKIGQLSVLTRCLLLHAKRHWPEAISPMLWPFALKYAAFLLDNTRYDQDGKTVYNRFSGNDHEEDFSRVAVWGCPFYVLDARLQNQGGKIPKWEPRSRLGIYLGRSPYHASSVALVYNPRTGHVSPQYHVTFDNNFSTLACLRNRTVPTHWEQLVCSDTLLSTHEAFDASDYWTKDSFDDEGGTGNDWDGSSNESGPQVSPTTSVEDHGRPVATSSTELVPPAAAQSPSRHGEEQPTLARPRTSPDFVNLERSGLRSSTRLRRPTARAANSSDKDVQRMFGGLYTEVMFCSIEDPLMKMAKQVYRRIAWLPIATAP